VPTLTPQRWQMLAFLTILVVGIICLAVIFLSR
jgi:hypothetical protein